MKKWTVLCILPFLSLSAAELKPAAVAPEDVTFLAHFNSSVEAETGGAPKVNKAAITTGGKGYAFKNSSAGAEALDVSKRGTFLAFDGAVFNPEQGTLQMFIQGKWGKKGHYNSCFFKVTFNDVLGDNWVGPNSFILRKMPDVQKIQIFQNGNLRKPGVSTEVLPHSTTEWRHLTVTWSIKEKKYYLYLDGELVGSFRYQKMSRKPVHILLGHAGGFCACAYIDEVRLLKRALTPAEVKQDFLYLKDGNEF